MLRFSTILPQILNRKMAAMMIRWFLALSFFWAAAVGATDSTSVLKMGLTIRSRIETTDNAITLDSRMQKGASYVRNRAGLMLQVFPSKQLELGIRLTNEFRYFFVPEGTDFNLDEVVIDQLYLSIDSIAGRPLSVKLGRQNISLGEGFVVQEGGPLDGSRTAYFNAAKFTHSFSSKTDLCIIYAYQQHQDDLLPIINDRERSMSEQEEQAGIVHLTTNVGSVELQGYLIQKRNGGSSKFPRSDITCPGLRIQAPLSRQLMFTTELAGQFGTWGDVDHQAMGGYAYAESKTGLPNYLPSNVTLGGLYLSGDDYTTLEHEGWEPMFGRWPKWSELYVSTLSRESAPTYWSNLAAVFAKTTVSLGPGLTLVLEYYHLMAPQRFDPNNVVKESDHYLPGGTGKTRGSLLITKLFYQFKPRLTGHLWFESFDPGNYYFSGADRAAWMRMEMMLQF
jgi:hypothetical protein